MLLTPLARVAFPTLFLAALMLGPRCVGAEDIEPRLAIDVDGHVVDFQRDVVPIFRARCLQCHGPEDAKADFRIDDVDTVMQYVEPEDLESSSLYTDYVTSTDDDMLMPPRSHGGPLSPGEIALVRLWIQEGADWPEDARVVVQSGAEVDVPAAQETAAAPTGLVARVWSFQGFLHPATVHFPIALLLVGGLFVALGWKWPVLGTQIPLACLLIGSASAIGASMMGWSFASEMGYGSWTKVDPDGEIFWHRWSAVIVTIASSVLAVVALASLRSDNPNLTRVWKSGLLVVALLVGLVGHQGGELTYGKDFYPKAFRILLGQDEKAVPAQETPTPRVDDPVT